ncbi:RNA-binding protein 18, partial [Tremellales sp. Uapishka_1]
MASLPQPTASTSTSAGKPDRLYVGNLSPTVDEYTLIQIFSKFGKIVKLDFMFHKTGVLKGKPRGFAFIEMSSKDDALKALVKLHDRLLRGRKLVVTYANSAPVTDYPVHSGPRRHTEAPTKTTLSLLKNKRRPQSAAAQIAAMEAKLASMQQRAGSQDEEAEGAGTPLSGGDADMEEELGQEEGSKAATELEKEMVQQLEGRRSNSPRIDETLSTSTFEIPLPSSLPPRPLLDASERTAAKPHQKKEDERAKAREMAFRAGLAGLPKKPMV